MWLCVIIISRKGFRENLHSIVAWMSRNSLFKTGMISECRECMKRVGDIIITYSQMDRTDKYSQYSSVIWSVWLNGWVFLYKISGSGFESRCCYLNCVFSECKASVGKDIFSDNVNAGRSEPCGKEITKLHGKDMYL